MHKVFIYQDVANSDLAYVPEELKSICDSLLFYKEVELPFPPFVGLNIVQGNWESSPLTEVTFNVDKQFFSCTVGEGNYIPDIMDKFHEDPAKTKEEIEKFLKDKVQYIKEMHQSDGWELLDPLKRS